MALSSLARYARSSVSEPPLPQSSVDKKWKRMLTASNASCCAEMQRCFGILETICHRYYHHPAISTVEHGYTKNVVLLGEHLHSQTRPYIGLVTRRAG